MIKLYSAIVNRKGFNKIMHGYTVQDKPYKKIDELRPTDYLGFLCKISEVKFNSLRD